jgi:hypothetical protein
VPRRLEKRVFAVFKVRKHAVRHARWSATCGPSRHGSPLCVGWMTRCASFTLRPNEPTAGNA